MESAANIQKMLYVIRGQKIMLDSDLAVLYGVETRVLNQAVRRNLDHFPADFMFELSRPEYEVLISQTVISKLFRIVFQRLDTLERNTPLLPPKRRKIGFNHE